MGLDYVELVMAVEVKFQISISDEEACSVKTVDDLYQIVLGKINLSKETASGPCLTSVAFYKTRHGIVNSLNWNRREIRPGTKLEDIFPRANRRRLWRRFRDGCDLTIGELEHSGGAQIVILATGATASAIVGWVLGLSLSIPGLALFLLMGIVFGLLLMKVTHPVADNFPAKAVTAGDLAKGVLSTNYQSLVKTVGSQDRESVWDALVFLIAEQFGLKAQQIRPESKFAEDLLID